MIFYSSLLSESELVEMDFGVKRLCYASELDFADVWAATRRLGECLALRNRPSSVEFTISRQH